MFGPHSYDIVARCTVAHRLGAGHHGATPSAGNQPRNEINGFVRFIPVL